MINQLRIYEIFERNKAAFHARFRDHAVRLMAQYDFRIVAMWETAEEGRIEFAYLLSWKDEDEMSAAWKRFRANEEWVEIRRVTDEQHGSLVGAVSNKVLTPTDYSKSIEVS